MEVTTIEMKETVIESPSSILSKEDTTMFSHHIRPNASLTVLTCAQMFTKDSSTQRRTNTLTLLPDKLIPPTFQTSPVHSPPLHSPLPEVGSPSPRTFRGSGAAVDCSTKMASGAGF